MPVSHTRPRSLRPRSTSITCSACSFFVGEQFLDQGLVAGRILAPGAGPCDGVDCHRVPFLAHEEFGGGADDLAVAEVEEVEIGGGVEDPQRAVDLERVDRGLAGQALGEHDLEGVSGRDVLLGPANHGLELLVGHVPCGRGFRLAAAATFSMVERSVEGGEQRLETGFGTCVGLVAAVIGEHEQFDLRLHVVEDSHRHRHEEPVVVLGVAVGNGDRLEMTHDVVADEPHGAAEGARHILGQTGGRGGQGVPDRGEEIVAHGVRGRGAVRGRRDHLTVAQTDLETGPQPDE